MSGDIIIKHELPTWLIPGEWHSCPQCRAFIENKRGAPLRTWPSMSDMPAVFLPEYYILRCHVCGGDMGFAVRADHSGFDSLDESMPESVIRWLQDRHRQSKDNLMSMKQERGRKVSIWFTVGFAQAFYDDWGDLPFSDAFINALATVNPIEADALRAIGESQNEQTTEDDVIALCWKCGAPEPPRTGEYTIQYYAESDEGDERAVVAQTAKCERCGHVQIYAIYDIMQFAKLHHEVTFHEDQGQHLSSSALLGGTQGDGD